MCVIGNEVLDETEWMDDRMIRKFLHRNYAFSLTQGISLDSYLLGNETRYLNHAKDDANCNAKCEKIHLLSVSFFFTVDDNLNSGICEWRCENWDFYKYVSQL